jgi:hypothetical protein
MRVDLIKKIEDAAGEKLSDSCKRWVNNFKSATDNARDLARELYDSIRTKRRGLRKDIEMLILEQLKEERKNN